MIETSLRMPVSACFSNNALRVFNSAVLLPGHEGQENLVDLNGVIRLITKRNYEVIPFLRYIRAHHAGGRQHPLRNQLAQG